MACRVGLALVLFLFPSFARADVVTKVIDYEHQGATLSGTLVYDDKVHDKRPGVLVVHDWMGHGPFSIEKAKELAALGYVAFAIDMYGKGIYCKDAREAAGRAGKIKADRRFMRSRVQAALEILKNQPQVDASKTGAIGFCFGAPLLWSLSEVVLMLEE